VPFVYSVPADSAAARYLLEHLDAELEALHEQQERSQDRTLSVAVTR
jgi:hypothetical protein